MRKETYTKNLAYSYDPAHSGAHYTLDHQRFFNHGELCEILAKSVLGYEPKKDANTRNDQGHDIPEIHASVKSWNCSLSSRKDFRKEKMQYLEDFFNSELPDTVYLWVCEYSEFVDLWYLDEAEMRAFVLNCASWDGYNCKWRFKMCDTKINQYLHTCISIQDCK